MHGVILRKMRTIFLFSVFLLITCLDSLGQGEDAIVKAVQLKEFIITAEDDLDAVDFMEKVISDSSFYQAFLNLKYYPHQMSSYLEVRNKGEKGKASLKRKAKQTLSKGMREVKIESEEVKGKLYDRKGEHRYLTAEMYDEIFFPKNPEPTSLSISQMEQDEVKGSRMEEYKSQLKKMMFNPGQEISSVPFIGDRMDIFSAEMSPYYDYSVYSAYNADSVWCFVFHVEAKPGMSKNKTVIKRMISFFDKEDMKVMNREYVIQNNTLLFDFNIWMKVDNVKRGSEVLPARIQYDGDWDIPFRSVENVKFDIRCSQYELR